MPRCYRRRMTHIDLLRAHGLFDARVPRYTSYPTAPVFSAGVGTDIQAKWLSTLDPSEPVSVYIHVPFCERLCWFCACRTQGTRTLTPVEAYIATVEVELRRIAALAPRGLRMGRLHWGGGTPTILPPALIQRLDRATREVFEPSDDFEFAVEIDPTMIDQAKIDALREAGMTRASIGVQDFDPRVQAAIGRQQPHEVTRDCVTALREAGVTSLNLDLVYGLPHQTEGTLSRTVEQVLALDPDRIALFGYAHVPHMSKRQKLIDESALPGDEARYRLASLAARAFVDHGFDAIGIDHFARPEDSLAVAARSQGLRRNFQGYTADTCPTLIGIGASAISRFPQGYVQNAAATPAYSDRIAAVGLAGARGHVLSRDDLFRGRVIEQLLCDFRTDDIALSRQFPEIAGTLRHLHAAVEARFADMIDLDETGLTIKPCGRPLARLIASTYDAWSDTGAIYSKAS